MPPAFCQGAEGWGEEEVAVVGGGWERRRDKLTVYTNSLQGQREGDRQGKKEKEEGKAKAVQEGNC